MGWMSKNKLKLNPFQFNKVEVLLRNRKLDIETEIGTALDGMMFSPGRGNSQSGDSTRASSLDLQRKGVTKSIFTQSHLIPPGAASVMVG